MCCRLLFAASVYVCGADQEGLVLNKMFFHVILKRQQIAFMYVFFWKGAVRMGIYLNPGNEAFKISLASDIYVDKSELIAFTNKRLGQEKRFLCVSRPRRFGKSMAANMLCAYYSKECDSKELFRALAIARDEEFEKHLNQYDVFFLNIQQFLRAAGSPDQLVAFMEQQILQEVKEVYHTLLPATDTSLPIALAMIFAKDKRVNKGFLFIIDEWDCIFREARENRRAQKAYLDFLKDLLKDRTYVKLAYMTGILPIKKYGTHSALNIFDEFSMTDPKKLARFVGFTEEEVKRLCESYGMDFEEAKRWYDGYRFRKLDHVYNPKSIVDAMTEEEFHSYWTGTETYEALKLYIDMNFDGLKDAIIAMLGGEVCRINSRKFQNDMTSFETKDDVLTLLVHLGYLAYDEDEQGVFIPNLEVAEEFKNAVEGSAGWEHLSSAIVQSNELLEATLNRDEEAVAKGIDMVHTDQISILSYNNENSLSCVITLAYFSARKDYTLIRELPTGKGFADIVFLPRKHSDKPAMIVELKWNQSAEGAINQIKNREYVKALDEYSGHLLLIGITYNKETKKHQCRIETDQIIKKI